jgi:hypothetical protein
LIEVPVTLVQNSRLRLQLHQHKEQCCASTWLQQQQLEIEANELKTWTISLLQPDKYRF